MQSILIVVKAFMNVYTESFNSVRVYHALRRMPTSYIVLINLSPALMIAFSKRV